MNAHPIINPNDNDISDIPLIKQIRFFINQVDRSNGIKLTKADNLPPLIVKELQSWGSLQNRLFLLFFQPLSS